MTQTAQTYGGSLYSLAREEKLEGEILSQLKAAADILRENPRYIALLSSQSIPKKERCAALDESFRGRVHPYLLNFMKILTENCAISQLPGCEAFYRRRYNEDHGIMEVTAITAIPLTEALQEKLRARLAECTGKTILLHNRVDAQILGGIRLDMDGKSLDGSVRNRLDDLRAALHNLVL